MSPAVRRGGLLLWGDASLLIFAVLSALSGVMLGHFVKPRAMAHVLPLLAIEIALAAHAHPYSAIKDAELGGIGWVASNLGSLIGTLLL